MVSPTKSQLTFDLRELDFQSFDLGVSYQWVHLGSATKQTILLADSLPPTGPRQFLRQD